MFFVYVLWSESLQRFYVGQTQDLNRRIYRHNKGWEKSTRKGRPWELKHSIKVSDRGEAMRLEKKLKNLSQKRLKRFIEKHGGLSRAADNP